MTEFYTNIRKWGNNILYIGYENGKRVQKKIPFQPSLYVNTTDNMSDSPVRSIYGDPLEKIDFGSMKEAANFVDTYSDVDNFNIFGQKEFHYQYIEQKWGKKDIPFDPRNIRTHIIDIEVFSPDEFPEPENAQHPIPCIALEDKLYNQMHVWYYNEPGREFSAKVLKYIELDIELVVHGFDDEVSMLTDFLSWYTHNYPDILSGWYSRMFDVPYLYNRLRNLFSAKTADRLSPWGIVRQKVKQRSGAWGNEKEEITYDIYGVNEIDYMDLYQKYSLGNSESYSLDFIAKKHLGVGKLEYEGSLNNLYKNNFQKYVEYNIMDTRRVSQLDDVLLYLELLLVVSYAGKVTNYQDTLGTVRYWESLIYHYLAEQNKFGGIKRYKPQEMVNQYAGGHVKEPQAGMHDWVVTEDFTSLYPSIIRQVNVGKETQIKNLPDELIELGKSVTPQALINKEIDLSLLKKYNVSMAANGTFYSKDKQSFMSTLMEKFFNKRKEYQREAKRLAKVLDGIKDKNSKEYKDTDLAQRQFNTKQMAMKILINSAYGALGNQHFIYYELDNATGITLTGQTVIQWTERKINEWVNEILGTTGIDYIVYIDTDSVAINMKGIVEKYVSDKSKEEIVDFLDNVCKTKLAKFIENAMNEFFDYFNHKENRMQLNREMIADKAVYVKKKRYCMNVLDDEGIRKMDDPYLKIMGIEVVKSSTPKFCRDKLKECIRIILQQNEDDLIDHIEKTRSDFFKLTPNEAAFPRGITNYSKWVGPDGRHLPRTPIHVRGSIIYNNQMRKYGLDKDYDLIKNGSKVLYIYLRLPNMVHENVISFTEEGLFKEFELDEYIDYGTQFEKAFMDPIVNLTEVIDWKTKRVNELDI